MNALGLIGVGNDVARSDSRNLPRLRIRVTIARLMGLVAVTAVVIAGSMAYLRSRNPMLAAFWLFLPAPLLIFPVFCFGWIDVPGDKGFKPTNLRPVVYFMISYIIYYFLILPALLFLWGNYVALPTVQRLVLDEVRRTATSHPTRSRP